MNTYIISSKSQKNAINEVNKILTENNVSKLDQDTQIFEKDLGIENVRIIQKKIYLKPLKGNKKSNTFILEKGASVEAQNALLKLLEEPPPSSLLFIVTQNHRQLLPTILSRAKIIEIKNDIIYSTDPINEINSIEGVGDSLYLAQILSKDKTNAIRWLEDSILATRELMLKTIDDKNASYNLKKRINNLEATYRDLKNTNANTRLALENLFLSI